jgi:hypothetical protein
MRRVVLSPTAPIIPAPRLVPALQRRRHDSAEFSLGFDAYVVFPAAVPARPGLLARVNAWSLRVRRLLADRSARVLAALLLAGFAWLCERGGAA